MSEIITERNLRCEEESRINVLTLRRRALLKVLSIGFLNTPSLNVGCLLSFMCS